MAYVPANQKSFHYSVCIVFEMAKSGFYFKIYFWSVP